MLSNAVVLRSRLPVIASILLSMVSSALCRGLDPQSTRLVVTDSPHAFAADMAAFDVCILPAETDLKRFGQRTGQQILLARLDPTHSFDPRVIAAASKAGLTLSRKAEPLSSSHFDSEQPAWQDFAVTHLITPLLTRGFDGIVLEGISDSSAASAELAKKVLTENPNAWVFIRDGFGLQGSDNEHLGLYYEGTPSQIVQKSSKIKDLTQAGLTALVVGFGEARASAENAELAKSIQGLGAVAFVTRAESRGIALAPLQEQSRRVLVLHGWNANESEKADKLPIDTMTADLFQTPLEWMGYEAEYFDVGKGELPPHSSSNYAAILLDAELEFPAQSELKAVKWLAEMKAALIPVLFTGGLPFSRDDARSLLRETFGLRGTLAPATHVANPQIVQLDADLMSAETKMTPRATDFKDLQAPSDARVLVELTGLDATLGRVNYTPAFLASWGGMWLEPSVILRGSQDSYLFYADPYKLLSALLKPCGAFPSPDTTTRDGCRLFYSHIDGDGFGSMSSFRGHPFCAELIRDRILKVYPFPITVSVIESEIRAQATGLDDSWGPRFTEIARSIFALPNIDAASHSYSHPYQWFDKDPDPGIYDEPFMELKPEAGYAHVDAEREVVGSVNFINKTLLPADKRVGLFLWSGNCRPGEEALRLVREMGMENMNGGNTIVSRLYPGIAGVAPRVVPWGDELQINASNQNEFMYANGWSGPFYGGFADVIDTFERTDSPRRLKPVNVYYHFYSATSLSSLRALEKIHNWCLEQPLHPVTAQEFAKLTKDAVRTRVFNLGPRHWLLTNTGHLRTYRLPLDLGRPDMSQCKGVTGYTEASGSLYVHTQGLPRTEIVLGDTPAEPSSRANAHIFLASSNAEIEFTGFEAWRAEFKVNGLRPVDTEFHGLPANAVCDVTIDNKISSQTTDAKGHLRLSLPQNAHVVIDANRSRYALVQ